MLSLLLFGGVGREAFCGSEWDGFLHRPNHKMLRSLERVLPSNAKACDEIEMPGPRHASRLFALIREGNQSAFSVGLSMSKCWDGGELEDFYRSAGTFLELEPQAFLSAARQRKVTESQLQYLLTMLPLELVDDLDAKIGTIDHRIAILKKTRVPSLQSVRKKSLLILQREKQELSSNRQMKK